MSGQFDDIGFAMNPDPRCPVVLVLDCSGSMGEPVPGDETTPIVALNEGLQTLVKELAGDDLAARRAEIAIVMFNGEGVKVASDFATVADLVVPSLTASGRTPLGEALNMAIDMVEERKRTYRANGITYYRPWILVITDGAPTDDITVAASRIRSAEAAKGLAFFPVAVAGADLTALQALSVREPMRLEGTKFNELFVWLSASQARVSASQPGDVVGLPSPAGWAEV